MLLDWVSAKGFAAGKSRLERTTLVLTIFGGWLFYLSKRPSPAFPPELTESFMLDQWADFWAGILGEDVPG